MGETKAAFTIEVLEKFPSLSNTAFSEKHLRVVRFNKDPKPRVDVRNYVESKRFTGWTKGASLTLEELEAFEQVVPALKAALRAHELPVAA
jgi:hypothetical protein